MVALHVGGQLLDGACRGLHRRREGRDTALAERVLEPARSGTDCIEVRAVRNAGLGLQHLGERRGRGLRLLDPVRVVGGADLGETGPELRQVATTRRLLRHLTEPGERRRLAYESRVGHRLRAVVQREPGATFRRLESAEVDAPSERLRDEHAGEPFPRFREGGGSARDARDVVGGRHEARIGAVESTARTRHARRLFAPLGPTYDRYARLLSFGQDPRWRSFLVSRIPPDAQRVLDVASGTAAVAIELARAEPARTVIGVDQSSEMLAAGRGRVEHARLSDRIDLCKGRAESLPFADGEFDALTFTYLLRYVDDVPATLRELVRVVRPGGTLAMLEFGLPRGAWRPLWELYVRAGLPAAGAVVSPGWREVGGFLGPSIRGFWRQWPEARLLDTWRESGLGDVTARRMSLGGGVVVWGRRT